jgi:hypothetical protein
MSQNHLYGPYFFPSTVTGDTYRGVISECFIPDLLERVGSVAGVWFQQDGAPAHTARDTKEFLKSQFETRVISHEFLHEWPPRSPDLTPCDFYLWGRVKEKVFQGGHFESVAAMQQAIVDAFVTIRSGEMNHVRRAVLSVKDRMELCVSTNGAQLQHL